MKRVALLVLLAMASARSASANATTPEPSNTRTDRDRLWHLAPMAGGGLVYLVLEFGLKDAITPNECRWCTSPGIDVWFRDAWKWDDVNLADRLSDLTSYVGAPLLAVGLLVATTADDPDLRRWYDDTIPVLQAGIITGMVNQMMKVIVGRQRPYGEFGGVSVQREGDVNTSFFSGHSALAFAMTTSSGMVASLRGYRIAPVLWIGGAALASVTTYLRIAADAHYATDMIAGNIVGAAIGVAVPLLFHRDHLELPPIVPSVSAREGGGTVSVSGTF